MRTKWLVKILIAAAVFFPAFQTARASADSQVTWQNNQSYLYDTTYSSLLYSGNPLGPGGLDLTTQTITRQKASADLAFGFQGQNIGARGVYDLGKVNYDDAATIPDSGYQSIAPAAAGHVYIIEMHDGKFAKVEVERVLASTVMIKYALQGQSSSSSDSGSGSNTGSNTGSSGGSTSYSYDISNSSLLYIGDPLESGGLNLTKQTMTGKKASADLVFGWNGQNIGARSVIDLGKVDFGGVKTVPDSGYQMVVPVVPGHVYLIQTHDGKFAKVEIEKVLASNIMMKYAVLDQSLTSSDTKSQSGSVTGTGTAGTETNQSGSNQPGSNQPETNQSGSNQHDPGQSDASSLAFFFHTWHLAVPGVAYTTDNYAENTQTLTISSGVSLTDGLTIHSDGTYAWNSSWDGKLLKGTWKQTDDAGYPIVLQQAQSGDDWKVGKTNDGKGIYVWDQKGFVWFTGTKVEVAGGSKSAGTSDNGSGIPGGAAEKGTSGNGGSSATAGDNTGNPAGSVSGGTAPSDNGGPNTMNSNSAQGGENMGGAGQGGTPNSSNGGSAESANRSIVLTLNSTAAIIDGSKSTLDAAPALVDNHTYVPLRFIGEALGADVKWNGSENSVTLASGGKTIVLSIDSDTALMNGEKVKLDAPAKMIHDHTMVPLRFVSESFNQKIDWNGALKQITIKPNSEAAPAAPAKDTSKANGGNADLSYFFHTYKLEVPGVAFSTDFGSYSKLTISPGAIAGSVTIEPDGTWVWNSSWDDKVEHGTWIRSDNPDYPILIQQGEDGENWLIGKGTKSTHSDIVAWDKGKLVYKYGYTLK